MLYCAVEIIIINVDVILFGWIELRGAFQSAHKPDRALQYSKSGSLYVVWFYFECELTG